MPYIGNPIYQSAFVTDTFSGNGTTTAFTMSVAPAGTTNVLVAVSGVLQDPSTYGVVGTTLNFSAAPPSGTGNISVRYLGVPATGVTTTAYRTVTEFTATAGQTTFTPPSYTVGFIDVYRNGVLLGSADFTATNGTTIVLANPATAGDLVETISFLVSSVLNAIPNTAGSVSSSNIQSGVALTSPTMTSPTISSGALTIGTARLGAGDSSSFKNRIINGDMTVDQRNAGASVSVTADFTTYYGVDRFVTVKASSGVYSIAQSNIAPAGFTASCRAVVTTADSSVAVGDLAYIGQVIEGYNVADLGWGTADAQTVTVSYWVRSNLTGTYCLGITNADGSRTFITNYTINSANTWEYKTITVPGDTTGTWGKTNGGGITIRFGLMAGTNFQQAAGSWGTVNAIGSSSQINWMATVGNDFLITGVQFERGAVATSFDYLPYTTELTLCQRYAFKRLADGSIDNFAPLGQGRYYGTNVAQLYVPFPVTMRTSPSSITVSGTIFVNDTTFGGATWTSPVLNETSCDGATVTGSTTTGTTAGNATTFYVNGSGIAFIIFNAEL